MSRIRNELWVPVRWKSNTRYIFSKMFGPKQIGFLEVFGGLGGFRKLREAGRKTFQLVSSKANGVVPSYDQKNKKVNE